MRSKRPSASRAGLIEAEHSGRGVTTDEARGCCIDIVTMPVPMNVGISVERLIYPPGAVRVTFTDPMGVEPGYLIELDPATSLQFTLMMVNAVAAGTNVFHLGEQAVAPPPELPRLPE